MSSFMSKFAAFAIKSSGFKKKVADPVKREQFLDKVWGYTSYIESRTVDVHIRTLRQKLGRAGRYIRTIRGIGSKIEVNEHET